MTTKTLNKMTLPIAAIMLAFVIGISANGIPNADAAAIDNKLVPFAERYQEVKELKESATGEEKLRLVDEETQLLNFLNSRGLPTDEQFEENPSYWGALRHDVLEQEKTSRTDMSLNQVVYSGDSQITEICGCTDALKLKAGYAVKFLGIWWHTYASSWTQIAENTDDYSTIDFDDMINDDVRPSMLTASKTAVKTIAWDWDYVSKDAGGDEIISFDGDESEYFPFLFTEKTFYMLPGLDDVETDSTFRFDADVTSITP